MGRYKELRIAVLHNKNDGKRRKLKMKIGNYVYSN